MISRRRCVCVAFGIAAFSSALLAPRSASAQVHFDVEAQGGVMKRLLDQRPQGGSHPGFGPVAELSAHVAIVPLVRAGVYVGHDISPLPGAAARDLTWAGVRGKVLSPWNTGDWRFWAFAGFGYAGAYARSYETTVAAPTGVGSQTVQRTGTAQGATGSYFEIPFGVGASYKLRKPWYLTAELGAHLGFAFSGDMYDAPGPTFRSPNVPDDNVTFNGHDLWGFALTVGVMFDM